jgi:site-specific DNA-cytosine methylase
MGFQLAEVRLLGTTAGFDVVVGIDCDAEACSDFERLTGAPALVTDIATMTVDELRALCPESPDVVFLSPPCLPAHGLVLMENGPRRIDSVRVGQLVLTHAGRYRRVKKVGTHVYTGAVYGFRLHGTVDVQEFTAEHPLWIRRMRKPVIEGRQRKRLGPPQFVAAESVRVGDRVGFPVEPEDPGCAARFLAQFGDPQKVTKAGAHNRPHTAVSRRIVDLRRGNQDALWYLLGAYVGDGYRRPTRHEVIFCVGPEDGGFAADVRRALDAVGLTQRFEDKHGGPTNIKIRVSSRHLCALTGAFGGRQPTRDIPPELMGLERRPLDRFIAGLRAADGSERPARTNAAGKRFAAAWKIVSTSLPLLRSLQRLLLRRGEFGAIHVAAHGGPQVIMGRTVATHPRWEIKVSVPGRRGFYDMTAEAIWVRVRSKTERTAKERVWNLEVDEDDTFCAPMMATHNCKGASGLLSEKKAKTAPYRRLNRLTLDWVKLMLAAWPEPPKLVLLENVPRLKRRAARMLRAVRALLRRAGYLFSEGFHDCGQIGGLAQYRRRYLLVARHVARVPPILYQPPKRRVRGVGEVLEKLPMPNDPAGGRLHVMPKLSWRNWIRLALIPAGGDWRDLPDVLAAGQERRAVFRRYHVEGWTEPSVTIAASHGPNGACAVADPRPADGIALPNSPGRHWNKYAVGKWDEPSRTVFGTSQGRIGSGAPSAADPRVAKAYDHGYMVLRWEQPSFTVHSKSHPGCGAYAVADPRTDVGVECAFRGLYGVLRWLEPANTVTGEARPANGTFSVADPRPSNWVIERPDGELEVVDFAERPDKPPCIIADDGTWHRPLTVLELAALQDFPTEVAGKPLDLAGSLTAVRERIGNAVPRGAARAIAEQMLVTLVHAELNTIALQGPDTPVWVEPASVEVMQ